MSTCFVIFFICALNLLLYLKTHLSKIPAEANVIFAEGFVFFLYFYHNTGRLCLFHNIQGVSQKSVINLTVVRGCLGKYFGIGNIGSQQLI